MAEYLRPSQALHGKIIATGGDDPMVAAVW
jgi:hypothetical protein